MKQIRKIILITIFILLLSITISRASTTHNILQNTHKYEENKNVDIYFSEIVQLSDLEKVDPSQKLERPDSLDLPKTDVDTTKTGEKNDTTIQKEQKTDGKIDTNIFIPNPLTEDDYDVAFNMAGTIINAITTIGIVIAVIMVMVLGIKYMVASVEQKAEYKRTMIPMIVGAILLFASSTFVSIIYSLISKIE